jgi:DNA polymerase-1
MGQDILSLWPTEAQFIRALLDIEHVGIRVNLDLCNELHEKSQARMDELTEQVGFKPSERTALEKFLLEDLGLPVVASSAKTGKPSFNKAAMEEYDLMLGAVNNDSARKVLEFRGWQKADSSCYVAYRNLVSPDGRIRPSFKIHGTKTGRLSCEKPNLQQIPRKSDKPWNGMVKQCFIPENDGYELWEFDYKTLEFRLAALYAGERALIQRVNDGQDLHQATADLINELTGIEISRQDAKTINFLILYGGGIEKLRWALNTTTEKAQAIYEAYHAALPGVKKIMRGATNRAKTRHYVKYWSGRKKHYGTKWNWDEEHKAFNALCQGGGAEMVKHSMVKSRHLVNPDRRMVLQVHDSIVWEIKKELVEASVPQISAIMSDWNFPVKFDVDAHIWGTG